MIPRSSGGATSGAPLQRNVVCFTAMAFFYDNNTDHIAITGDLRAFERIYCLNFSEFTDAHWERLDRIYQSLPGWVGYGTDGCP